MIVPFDPASVERAAQILRGGGLVAFPTETVYGLGARADDPAAVARIYTAKGRPAENPSIVHAATPREAFLLASDVPPLAEELGRRFWPGPLTLVLPVREGAVARAVTANGPTVALRVPLHRAALALLAATGLPLAAPSANRSQSISPTTASHVQKSLGDRVDLVLDDGPTGFGIESTIVEVTGAGMRVLRRGSVSVSDLRAFGQVIDVGTLVTDRGERARSPGTQARHYAPDTELVIVEPSALEGAIGEARERGQRVGVLVRDGVAGASGADVVMVLPDDPGVYAAGLYARLHDLDEAGCDILMVASVPEASAWDAVRDRLTRAAAVHP